MASSGDRGKFLRRNPGPWTCSFCPEEVLTEDDLHVHHVDHDRSNHAVSNLRSAHVKCHLRHHKAGKPLSEGWRGNISSARKGMKFSDEHRANMSRVRKGIPKSVEHRRKISDGVKASNKAFRKGSMK